MTGEIGNMEACIPALRRYASSLLRDRQDADDLVHDCLVRALDQLHKRRDDGDMRPWLFTIMHNLFVSGIRRQRVRGRPEPIEMVHEEIVSVGPTQDDYMESRDVMRAVEALTEEHRSVLLLVAVEDLSYAEVARVLDVPIGTVMSRLSRARERLRRTMDDVTPPAVGRTK